MATSQVIDLAATRAVVKARTGGPAPRSTRNRFTAFFAAAADVIREARELEVRMLGQRGYFRRFGES